MREGSAGYNAMSPPSKATIFSMKTDLCNLLEISYIPGELQALSRGSHNCEANHFPPGPGVGKV